MGKIKKILENELVGGTQNTDVYPVTSTKAVYDENNENLDSILKRRGTINVSTNYNADHIAEVLTLEQAIDKVPLKDKVLGFTMTFLSSDGWKNYQFTGATINNWTDINNWTSFVNDAQLKSNQDSIIEKLNTKVNTSDIVQQTGDSTTSVMSQKAVSDELRDLASRMTETSDTSFAPDLSIGDEDGNVIVQFSYGHIKTKNFDSRDVQSADKKFNYTYNAISKISLTKPKFGFDIKKIAEIGWGNQGFCIYNDYALVFSNLGTAARPGSNFAACKIFKITGNDGTPSFTSVTEAFLLEGYTPNHANTASLGSKYNEDDDFPLMYMPRCIIGSNQNCIVERISLEGTSQKVQEISIGTYRGEVTASSDIQWTTDGKFLYLFGNTKSSYSANGNKFVFCKLNLPNITSGDISVDLNDAIEFYYFEDYGFHNTNVLQGCKVINDMMILPVGFGSSSGATMSHLYFWDIIHRRLKADINLSALTSGEFEDVEYYKDSLLIFVGGGYIYQLKF